MKTVKYKFLVLKKERKINFIKTITLCKSWIRIIIANFKNFEENRKKNHFE
jgi:hypothetical protein